MYGKYGEENRGVTERISEGEGEEGHVRTDDERGPLWNVPFAGRPERPEGQASELREDKRFIQKEQQKKSEKDLVGDQLGVVTGVQGREDGRLALGPL